MNLFQRKDFVLHSGGVAHYKIECNALTDEDLETLAWIVAQKGPFCAVYGVPTGGVRFAQALEKHISNRGVRLIVDDVLTTGMSMEQAKEQLLWHDAVGVVIFARGPAPSWVKPLFQMHWINTKDTL